MKNSGEDQWVKILGMLLWLSFFHLFFIGLPLVLFLFGYLGSKMTSATAVCVLGLVWTTFFGEFFVLILTGLIVWKITSKTFKFILWLHRGMTEFIKREAR